MSCLFCIYYQGLEEPCSKGMTVINLSESLTCEHYTYNQRLLYDKSD